MKHWHGLTLGFLIASSVLALAIMAGCHREQPASESGQEPVALDSSTVTPEAAAGDTMEPETTDTEDASTVEDAEEPTEETGTTVDTGSTVAPESKTPPPAEKGTQTASDEDNDPFRDEIEQPFPSDTNQGLTIDDVDYENDADPTVEQEPAYDEPTAQPEHVDQANLDEDTPENDSSIHVINPKAPPDEDSGSDIYQVPPVAP